MNLRTLSAACITAGALSLGFAANAAEPVTAKLVTPIATEARIIAGGAMFVCRDALCVATAPTSRTLAVSACRDLAKVVGPLGSFGGDRRALDEGKLGQCNAAAPAPPAQIANR